MKYSWRQYNLVFSTTGRSVLFWYTYQCRTQYQYDRRIEAVRAIPDKPDKNDRMMPFEIAKIVAAQRNLKLLALTSTDRPGLSFM